MSVKLHLICMKTDRHTDSLSLSHTHSLSLLCAHACVYLKAFHVIYYCILTSLFAIEKLLFYFLHVSLGSNKSSINKK